jgi:hypothetical protein
MRIDRNWTTNAMVILSFLATLALAGCSGSPPESVDRPNLLVAAEGQVLLKREGWSDYTSVGFGTLLQWSDLLQVEGEASLLCGDLSIMPMSGRGSCPCPPAPSRLMYRGAYFRDSQTMPDVPYVLHPRNTLASSTNLELRWHDTGAASYAVGVVHGGKTMWSQPDVTGNSIGYPEDAPPLRPGIDYLVTVRDNDTGVSSHDDPTTGLGFRLLSKEERSVVEAERDGILAVKSLDKSARDLALAIYYATYSPSTEENRRLWGEAWLLLESVAQKRQDSPVVRLWIGDVLAATKLPTEAKVAYQIALEAAETLGDIESQAEAQAGLWRVTGDEQAWEDAVALYDRLGDRQRVKALREEREQ